MFLLFQTGRVNSYSASSEFQEDWVRPAHTHLPKRFGASLGRALPGRTQPSSRRPANAPNDTEVG